MIEKEAKKKWCPFAQVSCSDDKYMMNRNKDLDLEINCNCITTDCMAWYGYQATHGEPSGDCRLMDKE